MEQLRYLDFELKIERAGDNYCARVLRSPAGEASSTFILPFSEEKLELLVLKIGRVRSNTRRIHTVEMEAARELGGKLFEAVFGDEVRACLRSCLEEANRQEGTGLRLKLRLQDVAELADLPWEFILDPAFDRFLAQSNQTPIVRYIEMPESIKPLSLQLPLRVLGMVSSPADYVRLDVEREKALLQRALQSLSEQGKVTIKWLETPTLQGLQRCLRGGEYHVFHFIGHGGFDKETEEGILVLEDDQGRGWHAGAHRLGTILHDHQSLRLAVLNACEGARNSRTDPFAGVATTLIRQGIPAVVAMQFEITDEAAIIFADEFYAALAEPFPVDAAVAEARKAIYAQPNDVEWGTPVLYMRSTDGILFSAHERVPTTKQTERPKHKGHQKNEQQKVTRQIGDLSAQFTQAEAKSDWNTMIEFGEQILMLDANHQPTRSKAATAYNLRGMSYKEEGDHSRAFADANRAIELDPKNSDYYYLRGWSYSEKDDYDRALIDLNRAIELDPDKADYYGERGKSHFCKEDLGAALADLKHAIKLLPTKGEYYCYRGICYAVKGDSEDAFTDLDRAVDLYNRAIKINAKNAENYAGRGLCYMYKGEPDRAHPDFNSAIEYNPKNSAYYYIRATMYLNFKGEPDKALADIKRAIELDPPKAEYHNFRGICYNNRGEWDIAIEDFNRAIEIDSKKAEFYNGRADCFLGKREYDRALADIKRAIELNPNDAHSYSLGGMCYLLKEDYDRAQSEFNRAIELDPNEALPYYGRGMYYQLGKEDDNKALADFNYAIELDPNEEDYYFKRGTSYINIGNEERALTDLNRAIELDPKNGQYYVTRGGIYNSKGESELALTDLNRALDLDKSNAEYHMTRAGINFAREDYDNAFSDINRAIELDPNNGDSYYLRGIFYQEIKEDYDRALIDLDHAIELDSTSADYYFRRATSYISIGNEEQALADVNHAIRLDPQNGLYYFARGGVYQQRGNTNAARSDFKRAVELGEHDAEAALAEL